MSWSQTGRILLVFPRKGKVLHHRLALVLIKRAADELGAQLAFVTHDSEVRFFAHQIGIPVYKNLRQAQYTHWRIDKQKQIKLLTYDTHPGVTSIRKLLHSQPQNWLMHTAIRILSFAISVLALFVLGIFILPGATILLTPQEKIQSMTLSLIADPSLTAVNLSTGGLPTYSKEITVEGRESAPVTGSVTIPDQVATGGLRITNISDREIKLPSGTVITSLDKKPVRFITLSTDNIVINAGESASVSARSIAPGSTGNVSANSLVAIEGELGPDLLVTNPHPTHGGTDASVPAPSNQDIKLIRAQLVKRLEQTALKELNAVIPANDVLITPTLKIIEVIDESLNPALGEPGTHLNLSMRLRFQSQVVASAELNNLASPILEANTPPGYSPMDDTITLMQLTNPILGEEGIAHWTISIQRKLQTVIAIEQAINLTRGLSANQAIDRLNNRFPLAAEPQIILSPAWWPRLPLIPMRIQIGQPVTK